MKYSSILLIILSMGFLFSCKKKEEPPKVYRLTPEDKSWNIYHEGDTIKFKSNYNNYLTYYVGFIDQIIHNPNPNNNETWNSYEDIAVVFHRLGSAFINKHFTMSLVRGYPGDYYKEFLIMVWGFNFCASFDLFNLPRNPNIDTITVNNTLYHGVYMGINQMNNAEDSVAKNMFYDKQKGWLRFELKSGETYDRIN